MKQTWKDRGQRTVGQQDSRTAGQVFLVFRIRIAGQQDRFFNKKKKYQDSRTGKFILHSSYPGQQDRFFWFKDSVAGQQDRYF